MDWRGFGLFLQGDDLIDKQFTATLEHTLPIQCYFLCIAPPVPVVRFLTSLTATVVYRISLLGDTALHLSVLVL